MRFNLPHFLAFIGALLISFLIILNIYGCDVTKKQVKHYNKFIKYGGKINCKSDTLWKYDTTFIDGKVKIDSIPIPCNCPEVIIGYTNKQLRMILRHQKDSMNYLIKMEKIRYKKLQDSINGLVKIEKQETKQAKQITKQVDDIENTKQAESWETYLKWVFFICMVLGLIIALLKTRR
jgi:hypothetical protein